MSVWTSKSSYKLGETITVSWDFEASHLFLANDDSSTFYSISAIKTVTGMRSCSFSFDDFMISSFANFCKETSQNSVSCSINLTPTDILSVEGDILKYITIIFPAVNGDLAIVDAASTADNLISKRWVNAGDAIGIYSACGSEFTRELFYKLGSGDWISLDQNPAAIKVWEIPIQFAREFPSNTSITCTVCQDVYWDGRARARLEDYEKSFLIYVPNCEETRPKNVTAEKTILHALPAQFAGVPVQNLTKVRVTMSAESDYSTIESYSISGSGVSGKGNPAESVRAKAGDIRITCKVTDARGYSSSVELTQPVVAYAEPTILPATGRANIICERCNQTGDIAEDGTHLRILAKRSYSPVEWNGEALNDCEMQYRVNGGAWQTILEKTAVGDEVDLTLAGVVDDIYSSYGVDLRVVDGIGKEKTISFIVASALVDFHLWNGKAAFFKYAELDRTVDVNGDMMVREDLILPGGTVADYIIAKGSTGIWNWRKWASGAAECWGADTAGSETVTNLSITVSARAYPSSLFSEPPVEHFMLYSPDCNTVNIRVSTKNTKSYTAAYYVSVVNVQSTETVKTVTTETYYRAIGRWK